MAHAQTDSPEAEDSRAEARLDASMKLDAATLSGDEADFAAALGFGKEPAPAPTPAASGSTRSTRSAKPEDDDASGAEAVEPQPSAEPAETGPSEDDWESIAPRPAANSEQPLLEARAEALLADPGSPGQPPVTADRAPAHGDGVVDDAQPANRAELEARLRERERELTALRSQMQASDSTAKDDAPLATTPEAPDEEKDKQLELLRSEVDQLGLERDQLLDQLSTTREELAGTRAAKEKLAVSLQAARGALAPLPEGERALRAEVVGLRNRLEAADDELRARTNEIAGLATELAIATARAEDRENEVAYHVERCSELESERDASRQALADAHLRHREMTDLTARLRAENAELTSAQAALEETLQARDLEISAREEHLRVTLDGLGARDQQLQAGKDSLNQARRRIEALEDELDRAARDREALEADVVRRDERIARLCETLARIDAAIGERLPPTELERTNAPASEPGVSEPAAPARPAREAREPLFVSPDPVDTPAVLSAWRDAIASEAFDATTLSDLIAAQLIELRSGDTSTDRPLRVRSLAGGRLDAEVRLVQGLEACGVSALAVEVLDSDRERARMRRAAIERAGLGERIEVAEGDLCEWTTGEGTDVWLASDALHAQPRLEEILERIAHVMQRDAVFVFVGRLAGGPLKLSASVVARLEEIWAFLPDALTEQAGLGRPPFRGDDGGIAAADVDLAAALGARFDARVVAAFGHLADLVVGPARGAGLTPDAPEVERLLASIQAMDESRMPSEGLPARHGFGLFTLRSEGPPECLSEAPWPAPLRNADEASA